MIEWRFKLLYDGECPFCGREVRWLRRLNRRAHLAFDDISSPDFDPLRYGATREQLMGVIHGVFPDGRIVRKLEAFRQGLPGGGFGVAAGTDGLASAVMAFRRTLCAVCTQSSAAGASVRSLLCNRRLWHRDSDAQATLSRSMTSILVYAAGAFAVVLGIMHFTFPERFGFRAALSGEGQPLPPFRLWFYRYDFKRSDLYGIVRVMNHCVSFTILSVGVCDLLASRWLGTAAGTILAGWIAAFWFVRAATQLYLGRRRSDWFVVAWFGLLGIVHVLAAVQ